MDLSVIIPAYNEKEFIEQCCSSLQKGLENLGFEYEIIVVDNGSNDGTLSIVDKLDYVHVLSIDRTSVSKARNFGVTSACGKFLAFIDADVIVCDKWFCAIEKLCTEVVDPIVTGCQYLVRPNGSWIERYWFSNISSSHINGGNLIVSRSAFDKLGGFNNQLKTGEDVDFCDRAKKISTIVYAPDNAFEAIHLGYPRTLSHFMKREAWHGEGDFISLAFFFRSKVAIVATLYASIHILLLLLLIFGHLWKAILLFLIFISINYALTIFRFNNLSLMSYFVNAVLNYFYFLARFGSLLSALSKRSRSY